MAKENLKNDEIKRTIIRRFGSIRRENSSCNIEVNIIKWNNGRHKLDLRLWNADGSRPYKGLTLCREEYLDLMEVLCRVDPELIDRERKVSNNSERYTDETENQQEDMPVYTADTDNCEEAAETVDGSCKNTEDSEINTGNEADVTPSPFAS